MNKDNTPTTAYPIARLPTNTLNATLEENPLWADATQHITNWFRDACGISVTTTPRLYCSLLLVLDFRSTNGNRLLLRLYAGRSTRECRQRSQQYLKVCVFATLSPEQRRALESLSGITTDGLVAFSLSLLATGIRL